MRQIGCYRGLANQSDPPPEPPLNRTARGARALAGVAFIAQYYVPAWWSQSRAYRLSGAADLVGAVAILTDLVALPVAVRQA